MAQTAGVGGRSHDSRPTTVAIVGTGLAGLTTAYLLRSDKGNRFRVTLFEQADTLALDAASVTVKNDETGAVERLDLPMRACAGGYYTNLLRMYRHLGVPLHPVRFLFDFTKASQPQPQPQPRACEAARPEHGGSAPGSYFVHASNLHQTPPPWPANRGVVPHMAEVLYLIVCHFWFTLVCFLVPPLTAKRAKSRDSGDVEGETLADYLQRTWLPRRYVSHYLLPLMSSVSTCSHPELLAFPASDVINYKKLSHGQQHYAVCGGVHQVQSRLAKGMKDIRLRSQVKSVEAHQRRVLVRWRSMTGQHVLEQHFDHVVLAVSPDVAGRIFSPLAMKLGTMPTKRVESRVLSPRPGALSIVGGREPATGCVHHVNTTWTPQVITLRTLFSDQEPRTEALHSMPGGVLVSTSPLEPTTDFKATLRVARFTRALRTVESRATTASIMGLSGPANAEWKADGRREAGWVNGNDNVWLAGAWCWDGMVLLEGCVVSAMRVAEDLGVRIPWRDDVSG